MRKAALVISLVALSGLGSVADAREKWCAQIWGEGGRENCHFVSFQQCQASVSGRGGFCRPSQYAAPRQRGRAQTYGMGPYR